VIDVNRKRFEGYIENDGDSRVFISSMISDLLLIFYTCSHFPVCVVLSLVNLSLVKELEIKNLEDIISSIFVLDQAAKVFQF
jgi:hypothetical protein